MSERLSFRQRYVGPNGPHLNCLTETTRHGTYDPARQHSIHPGVMFGKRTFPLSHTAKPMSEAHKARLNARAKAKEAAARRAGR